MSTAFLIFKPQEPELSRRVIWQGFLPRVPDDRGRQLAVGTSGDTELHHRVINKKISSDDTRCLGAGTAGGADIHNEAYKNAF